MRGLGQLTLCRLREFYRDPVAVFWVHGFPVLVMMALGWAFSGRQPAPLGVELTVGPAQPWLERLIVGEPRLKLTLANEAEALARLKAAETSLVVSGAGAGPPKCWFDPDRPDSLQALALLEGLLRPASPTPVLRPLALRGVGGRYIDFLLPGLLGVGLMGGGLVGAGYVLVDQRRRGLLKRFQATPVRRGTLLGSLALARLVFLLPEAGLLLALGWLLFGVGCRGSLFLLLGVLTLGALQFLALGLFLGARLKTTEAVSGLVSLAMLTQWVFSGVFFGIAAFPEWAQPWLRALPLTPTVAALRKAMAGAASLAELGPDLWPMLFWTVGAAVVGWSLFRWEE